MSALVTGKYLKDVERFFAAMPDTTVEAARISINTVAGGEGLALLRKDVDSQINFPSGYVNTPDRLGVTKHATKSDLTAVITGRDRPTSLARFAPGQTPGRESKAGVAVKVKRNGRTVLMRRAFTVRLRNGNIGLAVRLKRGETLRNSEKAVKLGNNVYLLYGPSVDQVLRLVAEARLPEIGDKVEVEFLRQFARLSRGSM